jgi:isoleucyl-tRNA synthetase
MTDTAKGNPYKDTVLLPKTDFPMKAGLDKLEPQLQAEWKKSDLYKQIRDARKNAPKYVLHDGPPYATGDLHVGTGLNKALKDFVVRYKTMRGFDSPYRPGWDCHGLPIESRVMKELGPKVKETPTPELRKKCHEYAMKFFARNREEFERLGIFGEWQTPYLTVNPDYEAGILDVFADMVEKGYVYRALRPIHWCIYDETALAEAELEYGEETSPSVTVKFPLVDDVSDLYPKLPAAATVDLLIWTTTPWTLPANLAIAVHPEFDYALVEYKDNRSGQAAEPAPTAAKSSPAFLICAAGLVEANFKKAGAAEYTVLGTVKGKQLEGRKYKHVFLDRRSPVVLADYVTLGGEGRKADEDQVEVEQAEAGTGLVHTAPGHGREDFLTGKKYGLEILSPVDSQGRLTEKAGVCVGERVFDADPKIVQLLRDRGALFHHQDYKHSYPHCWRCHKPVMFRATEQWFVNVEHDGLRGRMLERIKSGVKWVPDWGQGRIQAMVERRPDWCISRQRHWGVAIPAFFNRKTGEAVIDAKVVRHVRNLFAIHGSGVWFEKTAAELLPPGFSYKGATAADFEKEHAIFDVWFESGASHRAVLKPDKHLNFPCDMYLEGSDQHRGWFQVSLITAMAADGVPPFKAVLTHGFVVDDKGEKMSKSSGNYISLGDALKFGGADLFRLWVGSIDYQKDINTSFDLMKRVHEPYRQFRNTLRILFGNLNGFDPAQDAVPVGQMLELDRWALSQLAALVRDCLDAYERFAFFRVYSLLTQFCSLQMSAFYVDVLKDRMYCDAAKGASRRSAQTAMYEILSALIRLSAPILVHTAEEAWGWFRKLGGAAAAPSVHLAMMPETRPEWANPELDAKWDRLLKVRADVNRELDKLRKSEVIGKSLEATVTLFAEGEQLKKLLADFGADGLSAILMTSQVEFAAAKGAEFAAGQDTAGLSVKVGKSGLPKCGRCWNQRKDVGSVAKHPQLCRRCAEVVG